MISKFLCSDVLAMCCIDSFLYIGMGCKLYIYRCSTFKLEKTLKCLYPHNIHGIVNGPNNKLVLYGANSLAFYIKDDRNILEQCSEIITFDDWIIAARWLNNGLQLAILFAHNNVYIYDTIGHTYQNIHCIEKCILYGGSISGNSIEDLVIFAGTVFREILIWKITHKSNQSNDAIVLHRLLGHKGVIFSVVYDPYSHHICSTSDDRTVRLWKVENNSYAEMDNVNWMNVNIKLARTMFGHSARVWRALIINNRIATIGEDSLLCIWSFAGQLLKKVQAHHGAAIWSISVSEDNQDIFTGGADGAVYMWSLTDDISKDLVLAKTDNNPKHICLLNSGTVIVFTEGGILLVYTNDKAHPDESIYLHHYKSYCIMQVSPCHSYIALASKEGHLTVYTEKCDKNIRSLHKILEDKVMDSQIFSLHWLEIHKILVCGLHGVLKILRNMKEGEVIIEAEYVLPPSRERWVTMATMFNELLICGDRNGNIHVFESYDMMHDGKRSNEMRKPIQTLNKVHGRLGAQSCIILGKTLLTAGRDGSLKFLELHTNGNNKSLCVLYARKMPMDWISGILKVSDDTLMLGFKETEFLIYSMSYRRILIRIYCGGGHRSWDCMISNKIITFAYIRNKQANMLHYPLPSLLVPIVQHGFHTKEICCVQSIMQSCKWNIFVSGSEDCTLRVSSVDYTKQSGTDHSFKVLDIFDGHLSNIKTISVVNLQTSVAYNEHLIFSGGGRAHLKIWRLKVSSEGDISCTDLKSHMLLGNRQSYKKLWQEVEEHYNIEPETRYMDISTCYFFKSMNKILAFIACSDGYLRIFMYDIIANDISLKIVVKCADRCILKIHTLYYDERIIVLTMSTDGIVRFFNFDEKMFHACELDGRNSSFSDENIQPFATLRLHQSGINCFDFKKIEEGTYLLATGGDDNLLSIVSLKIFIAEETKKLLISVLSSWNNARIHSTQITGVQFDCDNKIFSIGIDQQIFAYSYSYVNDALSVKILNKIFTSVADVQGMILSRFKKDAALCIYGKGIEIISL